MPFVNELIETAQHVPELDSVSDAAKMLASFAVAGTAGIFGYRRYNQAVDEYAADASDPVLLYDTIKSIKHVDDHNAESAFKENRRKRLMPVALWLSGVAILGGSYFGNLNAKITKADSEASVAFVSGVTPSMWQTEAAGTYEGKKLTRSQAVIDGLKQAEATYHGAMSVIDAGYTNETVIPMSKNWNSFLNNLNSNKYEQRQGNYLNLVAAMKIAAETLPLNGNTNKRSGTEVVATDGITDDSNGQIANEVNTLKNSGIKVEFIVPGNTTDMYKLTPSSPSTSAAPQVQKFASTGAEYKTPVTAEAIVNDTKATIHAAGNTPERLPYLPAYLLGGILLFAAGVKEYLQRINRVV